MPEKNGFKSQLYPFAVPIFSSLLKSWASLQLTYQSPETYCFYHYLLAVQNQAINSLNKSVMVIVTMIVSAPFLAIITNDVY